MITAKAKTRVPLAENGILTKLERIPVNEIDAHPDQPRENADRSDIHRLATSMEKLGQLQNIIVRKHEGRYQLIAGERRWWAAKASGQASIMAAVIAADDPHAVVMMVSENLDRVELNPIERARAFALLRRPRSEGVPA